MKHLIIHSIGPITDADIRLKQVNVIIGPQSLGKSTVLKVASYCTWVEKRIELRQQADEFFENDGFFNQLVTFHKMEGYFSPESSIFYESDYLQFSYSHLERKFSFHWKEKRWTYRRPKITYIPAERNLVAVIPNWFEISLEKNNIRNFMTDWETARRATTSQLEVLNLNVAYRYESASKTDIVRIQNGDMMSLNNVSSGLQALIPLFVHLKYLNTALYDSEMARKISGDWADETFQDILYEELFTKQGRTKAVETVLVDDGKGGKNLTFVRFGRRFGSKQYLFSKNEDIDDYEKLLNQYLLTDHCEVFLEEPENSLFPPTQMRLTNWLLGMTTGGKTNTLFIATHSPYVLSALLEKKTDIGLFFNHEEGGGIKVNTASAEDCQAIYDYGVDAFFNIENLGE